MFLKSDLLLSLNSSISPNCFPSLSFGNPSHKSSSFIKPNPKSSSLTFLHPPPRINGSKIYMQACSILVLSQHKYEISRIFIRKDLQRRILHSAIYSWTSVWFRCARRHGSSLSLFFFAAIRWEDFISSKFFFAKKDGVGIDDNSDDWLVGTWVKSFFFMAGRFIFFYWLVFLFLFAIGLFNCACYFIFL